MKSLKDLEQEALADFQSKIEYGVSNNPWAIDYIDEIAPQIKEWIIAYGRKVAEMSIKEIIDATPLYRSGYLEGSVEYRDGYNAALEETRAEQLRRKDGV